MANAKPASIGTLAAAPASGTVTLESYSYVGTPWVHLKFTLTAASIPVTDAAGSGSSGSLKLFDFNKGVFNTLYCAQIYTAFAEGAALTTAAGDAAFVLALGSVAANAGDGALTGTEVDIGSATATLTNSGGTTTGSKFNGPLSPIDGRSTANDIYLNWSGSAATIDANSTIAVTGTIEIIGMFVYGTA